MVTRKQFNDYMMPVYNPAHFIPVKGKGSIVWDSKNKKYRNSYNWSSINNPE